jgi:hypothetical protein
MSLEELVRSTLKDAGSRINPAQRRHLDASPFPRRRQRFTPVLVFLAGVAGVLLFGLLAVLLQGNGTSQVADNPVQPLDSGEVETLGWTAVNELPTNHAIRSVAEGPNGWLALAGRFVNSMGGEYLILHSSDGVTWTRLDSATFPAAVHVDEIVGHEDGYIAYGLYAGDDYTAITVEGPSNFPDPAVWTSADGAEWELVSLPLPDPGEAISEIVSYRAFDLTTKDGLAVALGYEFDEDLPDVEGTVFVPTRLIMWESTQPGEWSLVQPDGLEDWIDLAFGPAGIIAITPSDSGLSIMSWADGIWTETGAIPGDRVRASLVGSERGYLVQSSSRIFYSADANTWTPVDGPKEGLVIAADSGGFTVIGRAEGAETVWWSPDGTSWTAVGSDSGMGPDLKYVSGAGASERAVFIFGQTGGRDFDIEDSQGFLLVGTKS